MKNSEKSLVAGILIGAAVATTAIIVFIKKTMVKAEVHLFDLDEQEGKEEQIDDLIPWHTVEEEENGEEVKSEPAESEQKPEAKPGKKCAYGSFHRVVEQDEPPQSHLMFEDNNSNGG